MVRATGMATTRNRPQRRSPKLRTRRVSFRCTSAMTGSSTTLPVDRPSRFGDVHPQWMPVAVPTEAIKGEAMKVRGFTADDWDAIPSYMFGDQDRPPERCGCRGCTSEGRYE